MKGLRITRKGRDGMLIDYIPCKECENSDVWYTCHKCGKCGREFQNGILINGLDYPGYDPETESEE